MFTNNPGLQWSVDDLEVVVNTQKDLAQSFEQCRVLVQEAGASEAIHVDATVIEESLCLFKMGRSVGNVDSNDLPRVLAAKGSQHLVSLAFNLAAISDTFLTRVKSFVEEQHLQQDVSASLARLVDLANASKPVTLSCVQTLLDASANGQQVSASMASEIQVQLSDIEGLDTCSDGSIQYPNDLKTRLLGGDLQSVVATLDDKMGLAKAFKKLNGNQESEHAARVEFLLSGDLPFRLKVIPVLWKMMDLDEAVVAGKTYNAEAFKKFSGTRQEVDSLLDAFQRQSMVGTADVQKKFTLIAKTFLTKKMELLSSQLAKIVESMRSACESVDGLMLDFQPALRRFEAAAVDQIIDMPQRATVVQATKTLNALFSKWREESSMVCGAIDIKEMSDYVKKATELRDKCRVLIAVRSGLSIWKGNKHESVNAYYKECAKARTHIPARLRAQLDKLKETSAEAAAEGEPESDDEEDGADEDEHHPGDDDGDMDL